MKVQESSKKLLKIYGIFAGILIVTMFMIIGMVRISERSWNEGLRRNISNVLEEKYPGKWAVGENLSIKTPLSLSAVCCKLSERSQKEENEYYALILRVETFYGPFPGVFIYNKKDGASFVGFSDLHGRVADTMQEYKSDARILYWKKRIPDIMKTTKAEK